MIEVLGVKNADKLVPVKDDITPTDPVSENMAALVGKPLRAFLYQDHDAHITTHTSFMQDPMIAQTIGQNPQAQQIMASLQAHIAEHLGFSYRKQIEERLGVPLPHPDKELPEEIEVNLAQLVADAGKQLTQAHQQQQAQKEAQEQAQDPILQLRREEVAIKKAEVDRKAQKDQADSQLQQADLLRKAEKDKADIAVSAQQSELDKAELMLSAQKDKLKIDTNTQKEADKLDLEIFKAVTSPSTNNRR
jgi:hypothetical protein